MYEKNLLIQALEQSQKKFQDSVTKAKDEKKKMNTIIDSFKTTIQGMDKPRSTKETQTQADSSQQTINSNKNSGKSSPYNSEFINNFETLLQKLEEITVYSNSLLEENNQMRSEIENYKKYSDSLKNYVEHHKTQIKKQENMQSSMIEKSKSLVTENHCFKEYLKELSMNKPINDNRGDAKKTYKSIAKVCGSNAPVPSYLKALSLAIKDNDDVDN